MPRATAAPGSARRRGSATRAPMPSRRCAPGEIVRLPGQFLTASPRRLQCDGLARRGGRDVVVVGAAARPMTRCSPCTWMVGGASGDGGGAAAPAGSGQAGGTGWRPMVVRRLRLYARRAPARDRGAAGEGYAPMSTGADHGVGDDAARPRTITADARSRLLAPATLVDLSSRLACSRARVARRRRCALRAELKAAVEVLESMSCSNATRAAQRRAGRRVRLGDSTALISSMKHLERVGVDRRRRTSRSWLLREEHAGAQRARGSRRRIASA